MFKFLIIVLLSLVAITLATKPPPTTTAAPPPCPAAQVYTLAAGEQMVHYYQQVFDFSFFSPPAAYATEVGMRVVFPNGGYAKKLALQVGVVNTNIRLTLWGPPPTYTKLATCNLGCVSSVDVTAIPFYSCTPVSVATGVAGSIAVTAGANYTVSATLASGSGGAPLFANEFGFDGSNVGMTNIYAPQNFPASAGPYNGVYSLNAASSGCPLADIDGDAYLDVVWSASA